MSAPAGSFSKALGLAGFAERAKEGGGFLFLGRAGEGKFSAAKEIAAELLETTPERLLQNPDAILVDLLFAKEKEEDLEKIGRRTSLSQERRVSRGVRTDAFGSDDARQLAEELARRPLGARKILLFRRAERLTEPATNTLLKTLEELASQTLVIFTAATAENLLPTLASRLSARRLPALSLAKSAELLEEIFPGKNAKERAKALRAAAGRAGRAAELLEEGNAADFNDLFIFAERISDALAGKALAPRAALAESLRKELPARLLPDAIQLLAAEIQRQVREGREDSGALLRKFLLTNQRLSSAGNPQLALQFAEALLPV